MTNKERYDRNAQAFRMMFQVFLAMGFALYFGAVAVKELPAKRLFLMYPVGAISYLVYLWLFSDRLFSVRGGILFYLSLGLGALISLKYFTALQVCVAGSFYATGFTFVGTAFWEWQVREHRIEHGVDDTVHKNKDLIPRGLMRALFKRTRGRKENEAE